MRKPETGELAILSFVCVPEGDDFTLRFLGELFLRSAPDHGAGVARLFVDARCGPAEPDAARPWRPEELDAARDTLVDRGIPVELSPGLLSIHKPYPWLGNGLTVVL